MRATGPSPMAGYSPNPLWKKLGYRTGLTVYAHQPPANYRTMLALPSELTIQWAKQPASGAPFIHAFVKTCAELGALLAEYRRIIAPDGTLWISWPKQAAKVTTDVTENRVRDAALPLGFVDVKVCAVDETWSGLKLVIRKELR